MQADDPQPDYRPAWRDYRRRELSAASAFFGPFVAMAAISWLGNYSGHPGAAGAAFFVLAPVWVIGSVVANLRLHVFPCPRCGHLFFIRHIFDRPIPFVRTCRNCRLRLFAATDDGKWFPPDEEEVVPSITDGVPTWRWALAETLRVGAWFVALAALAVGLAVIRWLATGDEHWTRELRTTVFGVELSPGQVALLAAIVAALGALVLRLLARRLWRA